MPIAAISAMTGIDRKHLYAIIKGVSAEYCERRTPLIRDIESSRIAFRP